MNRITRIHAAARETTAAKRTTQPEALQFFSSWKVLSPAVSPLQAENPDQDKMMKRSCPKTLPMHRRSDALMPFEAALSI